MVTAAEVRAAIHSGVPAQTLDALKRRLWVMTGPCQGSLCLAPLILLLAHELRLEPRQIRKNAPGSEILTGPCRVVPPKFVSTPAALASLYDVVVVGAGPAGCAAALAARQAGAAVALVDRAAQPGGALAALGLAEAAPSISSLVQAGVTCAFETTLLRINRPNRFRKPDRSLLNLALLGINGFQQIRANAIILATGGREITRGNLILPGTRPAGVLTAGTALRLLAATGCLPGQRAVLCGESRWANLTAGHLVQAGVEIVACLPAVSRIEGQPRIEGVIDPEGQRITCDLLVLTTATIPWRPAFITDNSPGLFVTGSAAYGELDGVESAQAGVRSGQAAAQWALASLN